MFFYPRSFYLINIKISSGQILYVHIKQYPGRAIKITMEHTMGHVNSRKKWMKCWFLFIWYIETLYVNNENIKFFLKLSCSEFIKGAISIYILMSISRIELINEKVCGEQNWCPFYFQTWISLSSLLILSIDLALYETTYFITRENQEMTVGKYLEIILVHTMLSPLPSNLLCLQ